VCSSAGLMESNNLLALGYPFSSVSRNI
jgi:hypothetical protein